MYGQVRQATFRPSWRAHTALLGASGLQCMALPEFERSTRLRSSAAFLAVDQQRGSVLGVVNGQDARDHQSNDAGQEPARLGRCRPTGCDAQGRMHQGRPAVADALQDHGPTGLREPDETHRGVQGLQRLETDHDAGHGPGSNTPDGSGVKGGFKNKTPSPEIGCYQSKNWTGQADNQSRNWTMDRATSPETGRGENSVIARKPNAGAACTVLAEILRSAIHSPKTGLLSTVATPWGLLSLQLLSGSLS
jgi:hypothetical protein